MRKLITNFVLILMFMIFGIAPAIAQDKDKDQTEGWKRKGLFSLLFNQAAFSDSWQAGGISSIAGSLGINYDFNYTKGNINWDNKVILAYGLTKLDGANFQKSDDRLEYNSLFGKKTKGYWFYSAFFNFKTQMDIGEVKDADGNLQENSRFFSPAYFQAGPGMLWKKNDNFKINIAPITSRIVLVSSRFTERQSAFGVEKGKTSRFEFGGSLGAYLKKDLMKNVSMENILNLYSNYIEDPQNIDLDYTMNLVMKINKYLSANLNFQAIYDDNAVKELQTKQVFGAGLNILF